MSQWGKLDNYALAAQITASLNSNLVSANNTVFSNVNVQPGYAILIDNVAYRIETINTSANTLTLDKVFTSANVTTTAAYIKQSPKDLTTYGWAVSNAGVHVANVANKRTVYGIDRVEANVAGNKANGFSQPGWTYFHTYTTTQGSVRKKAEVLVAMSKNFNANATNALFADANDNTIIRNS